AGLANAALQNRRHIQLLRNRRDVHVFALEVKRRRARRHAQATDLGEDIQQLFRETVGKVFLVLLGTEIRKRQHRDRRHVLVQRREQRFERWKRLRQIRMAELEHSLTPRQVLERVLAEGLERRS